jgi:hypothetical protein
VEAGSEPALTTKTPTLPVTKLRISKDEPSPEPASPAVTSFMTLAGRAIDGPVEGGRVYVDINGNGTIDDAERQNGYVGMTDGSGHYSGQVNSAYHDRMIMIDLSGATDHGSNLDDPADNQSFGQGAYWRAPPGSTILSPLTEILVRIYGVSASATDKATFAESLNLSRNIDITQYDAFTNRDAPDGQRLLALGRFASEVLREWGDGPLNQGETGQAYVTEIIRRHDAEVAEQTQPAPSPPSPPPEITLSRERMELDQNSTPTGPLAVITIEHGDVADLVRLPDDSLFEYRNATRNRAELWLKQGTVLDQARVGITRSDNQHPRHHAGAERGQRFELQVIDVDDVPTGWRLQPNHAVGLDDLHPNALSHTSVASPLLEYANRTSIPAFGTIVTRDLRPEQIGKRIKIMDLIVDDPDINPDFRQWGFRLHGEDKQYLEIIGNQVFIKAGIVTVEMGHPDYYSQTTLPIGIIPPHYIELVGLDKAYLFILFIEGNRPSHGDLQIRLQTPEAAPATYQLAADTSGIGDDDRAEGEALRFTYRWEKIGWQPGTDPLLTDQPHLAITENGVYRLTVIAHDDVPRHNTSFTTEFTKTFRVNEDALRPEPVTSPDGAIQHSIHENRPLYLPVYDFTGDGDLADGGWVAGQCPCSAIDAATGKLWFNSQPGYRVLNYENPQDEGADNIYDIRVERTAADGQREVVDLALAVQDIVRETIRENSFNGWDYRFTYAQVRPLIEAQTDWTAEEQTYAGWLLEGNAWAMPEQGPLIITWGIDNRKWVYKWYNYPDGARTRERVPATDEEIAAYRAKILPALRIFEETINVKFIEVDFFDTGRGADGPLLEFRLRESDSANSGAGPGPGSYVGLHMTVRLDVILHELAHSFGLSHPFFQQRGVVNNRGEGDFPRSMTRDEKGGYVIQTGFDSVMSYARPADRNLTEKDIKVLQFLYGAPNTDYEGLQDLLDLDIPPPAIIDWL